MPKKNATADDLAATDHVETERPQAETPPDVHAHLGPTTPPQYDAATDDPAHPLHHHAKRDSLESPTSEE